MAMMMPMDVGTRIGMNLARVMKSQALTQGQVAVRAGLTQPVISALVNGATQDPPISTLLKISNGLSLPLDDLLADVDSAADEPDDVVTRLDRLEKLMQRFLVEAAESEEEQAREIEQGTVGAPLVRASSTRASSRRQKAK